MATRSEIFGPDGRGRYHHWDGYPTALGKTLWSLYHNHFKRNIQEMRKVLLEDHPAGWSTINEADWSLEPGFNETGEYICTECNKPANEHYYQYLNAAQKKALGRWNPAVSGYRVTNHEPVRPEQPKRPQCYCHGDRSEETDDRFLSGLKHGEEYAYVLEDTGLRIIGYEKLLGFFSWNGDEPNWEDVERTVQ